MATKSIELAKECQRQYENCLYTAVSQLIWLKWLRVAKIFFTLAPLVMGSLGSWKMLTDSAGNGPKSFAAVSAFLAGLISTIYSALRLDTHIEILKKSAGELTNLRDQFRLAALVSSKKPFDEFEMEFVKIRDRLDKIRSQSITPPEFCFWLAKRKINASDYSFDMDESES